MRDASRIAANAWRTRWRIGLIALVAVLFGSAVRIHTALADPGFDEADSRGMLRSDPGLLFYVTERVVEARGGVPGDWRADPRVEHPERFDVPANLTVGEEFLVAWVQLLTRERFPLHVVATWVMGIVASLMAVGVLGLAWELTRSVAWSALAVSLHVLVPASYRTIGFVLVNEDLSLPLVVAHLWLLARAARVRTPAAFAWAGIALGGALATWHATSFFVALEAALVLGCFLWSGANPFAARRSWVVLVPACLVALAVPALRAKLTLLSPPFVIGFALLGAHLVVGGKRGGRERLVAIGLLALLLAGSAWASRGASSGLADFSHVWSVLAAKLAHFGRFPSDPSTLSFEARLLWQGPFQTMTLDRAFGALQLVLLVGVPAGLVSLVAAMRGRAAPLEGPLVLLLAGTLAATWLVERVSVFVTPLFAIVIALSGARLVRWRRETLSRSPESEPGDRSLTVLAARLVPVAVLVLLLGQTYAFADWHADLRRDGLAWYRPHSRAAAMREALEAVERHVPPNEAVAADFMLSTAILAHTRCPIVLQPKWESRESRARVEEFWNVFYHGTPVDLRRLLLERWQCSWLLLDHSMLGELRASRRLAGLADSQPLVPGSAAEALLTEQHTAVVPEGFTLVWTSAVEDAAHSLVFTLWTLGSR